MLQNRPLRVLHVLYALNYGGIETWLLNVARHLDREQVQMDFLVHTSHPGAYDKELERLGCRIISCSSPSHPIRYAIDFLRVLKVYGPYDIIHSHMYLFSGYVLSLATLGGRAKKIAHIYPIEDLKQQKWSRRLYSQFMGRLIELTATGVLADSKAALQAFLQNCPCSHQKQEVIYPVVDLSRFNKTIDREAVRRKYGLPTNLPIVVYVARFEPHKNHHGFLEIAHLVNTPILRAHFLMIGSQGRLLEPLKEDVKTRNDVTMLTNIEDISALLLSSDLFLFPSLHEGFGIVSLEAQAAGLPVIATKIASIEETLAPVLRSLMFGPEDLTTAVQKIIALLLLNEAEHSALRCEIRDWILNFSVEASSEQLSLFYNAL